MQVCHYHLPLLPPPLSPLPPPPNHSLITLIITELARLSSSERLIQGGISPADKEMENA